MPFGWMGRYLDVNLTTRMVQAHDTMLYAREYIGGRGIAARLAWETIPPGTGPFAPENRLIVFTGPLTGTIAPTSGRTVFVSVSPRVYPQPWFTHSTMGGWFGPELKYAGFDGLVIHGVAAEPAYLYVEDGRAELKDATALWGLGTREVQRRLKEAYGAEAQVICIGPAGENLARMATIQHADECASGHSGFGAVLGAKRLKAVVVRGTGGVPIARPAQLLAAVANAREIAWVNPLHRMVMDPEASAREWGTLASRPICSQSCTVMCGTHILYREEGLPDEVLGCIGRFYAAGSPPAYENGGVRVPGVKPFGPREGARVHALATELGLDHWLLLSLQPWFLRCIEENIASIRGMRLDPTNSEWFMGILEGLAQRRGLGSLFAESLRRAADALEGELPGHLIGLLRHLEFAYGFPPHREGRIWDPEPLPYWVFSALMYATESRDPAIGTHSSLLFLADLYLAEGEVALQKFRRLGQRLWGSERALEPNYDHAVPVAVWTQHQHILIDSLTLCDFAFPRTVGGFRSREEWLASPDTAPRLDIGSSLLSACTGLDITETELEQAAERTFNVERAMLAEFGRDRQVDASIAPHFRLPCSTDGTCLADEAQFEDLLDAYYDRRGWDHDRGWPTRAKLCSLGLDDVADRLGV